MRKLIVGSGILFLVGLALGLGACGNDTTKPSTSAVQSTMTDSQLEDSIKAKIDSDAALKAADIDVSADAETNTATLSGTVESEALRQRAVELAKAASAGLVVTDKIDVKPREVSRSDYTSGMARQERERAKGVGETIGDSIDDAWIHTKIVTKLIGSTKTPERKINVDVVNNVVTLRGTVTTTQEKAEAERIARETEGVKSVKNQLKVSAS